MHQLRTWRTGVPGRQAATCASTTRTRASRGAVEFVESHPGGRALARLRLGASTALLRLRLLRGAVRASPADLIESRRRIRLRPELAEDTRRVRSGTADRGRPRTRPIRDRSVAEKRRPVRAHAGAASSRTGQPDAAGEDRHGAPPNMNDARSHPLPPPERRPPSHRRRLAPVPDVRLRALPLGRDRGHHPLALLARVRRPAPALRLDPRAAADPEGPAPDRVRPAQPDAHGHEQAHPAPSRGGGSRRGLGRPAHADARRAAPPGRLARRDPALLRGDRGQPARQHPSARAPRAQHPRGPERDGAPRDGRDRPPPPRDRELSRGRRRDPRGGQQPAGRRRRHAPGPLLAHAVHRARGLRRGPAEEVQAPGPGARGAAALRLLRHLHGRRPRRRGRGGRGPLHLRSRHPGRRRPRRPQGEGHDPLGVGPSCRGRRGAAVRHPVLDRGPDGGGRGRRARQEPEPGLARGAHELLARAQRPGGRTRQPLPARAPRLLLRGPGRDAGDAGPEPHRHAPRQLGQDRQESGIG